MNRFPVVGLWCLRGGERIFERLIRDNPDETSRDLVEQTEQSLAPFDTNRAESFISRHIYSAFQWARSQHDLGLAASALAAKENRPPCVAILSHYRAFAVFKGKVRYYATRSLSDLHRTLTRSSSFVSAEVCEIPNRQWNLILKFADDWAEHIEQ